MTRLSEKRSHQLTTRPNKYGNIFGETAPAYFAAGLSVIPLSPKSKKPVVVGWTGFCEQIADTDQQAAWFRDNASGNLGLALGPASGVVVVDVDYADGAGMAAIESVLPPSPWRRVGAKGWVQAYLWADGVGSGFKILGLEGETLVEVLGLGRQVVLPPSIHPDTGQPYTANCHLPEVLDQLVPLPGDIERRLREALVGAGVALGDGKATGGKAQRTGKKRGVARGGRDNALTEKAGALAKAVWGGRKTLVEAVREIRAFASTFEQPAGDVIGPERGVEKLMRLFEKDVAANGCPKPGWDRWLDRAEKEALGIHEVVKRTNGPGEVSLIYTDLDSLADSFYFDSSGDCGNGSFVCKDTREEFSRRQFASMNGEVLGGYQERDVEVLLQNRNLVKVYGKRYSPGEGAIVKYGPYEYLNSWRDSFVCAVEGDISTFLSYLYTLIPDGGARDHILQWMAHAVQKPYERVKHAIILTSEIQGIGKSTLPSVFARLIGDHNTKRISTDDIKDRFGTWASSNVLIIVEELMARGRVDIANKLKPLITEEKVSLRGMYKESSEQKTYCRYFITSNHDVPVVFDQGDRRYFIYKTPASRNDFGESDDDVKHYFNGLYRWIEDEKNLRAVMHYLKNYNISKFDPSAPPPND